MSFLKTVKTKLFLALTLVSLGLLAGCTGDSNVTATTTSDTLFAPSGIIQGTLLDVCTNAPIANAVLDIGVKKVVTKADGTYSFPSVPATTQADGSIHGDYSITIDLSNAKNAAGESIAANYPEFAYDDVKVVFAVESTKTDGGVTTTKIIGVASGDQDLKVGQLKSAISGRAFKNVVSTDSNGNVTSGTAAAGYYVALYASTSHHNDESGSSNSTTGANENLIKTTTVNAQGVYSFTGLENQRDFHIVITDTDPLSTSVKPSFRYDDRVDTECGAVVSWADDAVVSNAPSQCVAVSPSNYTDYQVASDGSGSVVVKFTFTYAVTPTNLNGLPISSSAADVAAANLSLTSAGNPGSLYALVAVNYLGLKASNVAHTLVWSGGGTVLTVTIPNAAPAAIYNVSIAAAQSAGLFGSALVGDGSCGNNNVTIYTFGSSTAAAPVLRALNLPYDYNSDITLSWTNSSQAKGYNVYCAANQVWGATTESGPFVLMNTGGIMTGTIANFPFTLLETITGLGIQHLTSTFIENQQIKITWSCEVKGVNADGTEGPASNIVTMSDTVFPQIVSEGIIPTPLVVGPTIYNLFQSLRNGVPFTQFTISYNEPMNKNSAEVTTNYHLDPAAFIAPATAPTVTNAVYDVGTMTVTLTLSAAIDPTTVHHTFIDNGANGVTQTNAASGNIQTIKFGEGKPHSPCVVFGNHSSATHANHPPNEPAGTTYHGSDAALDDVQVVPAFNPLTTVGATIVDSGINGICETTKEGNDVQALPIGTGTPSTEAISASNFAWNNTQTIAVTAPFTTTDDILHEFNMLTVTGVTDVAGNAIDGAVCGTLPSPGACSGAIRNKIYTDGWVHN